MLIHAPFMPMTPFRLSTGALALILLTTAAPAADQVLNPPPAFLVSNYIRSTRAAAKVHQTVIDVPQGATAKTRPTIARSSGDPAADVVAARYVQLALERSKTVQTKAATQAQRFQVRLQAGALDPKVLPKHLQRPNETVDPKAKVDLPRVPRLGFLASNAADPEPLLIRMRFPATGGMPDEAILVKSSGQVKVDAAVLLYALANARGKASDRPYNYDLTVSVGRRSEPSDVEYPPNFPSNERMWPR